MLEVKCWERHKSGLVWLAEGRMTWKDTGWLPSLKVSESVIRKSRKLHKTELT
jgi:hypothetical protein